MTRLTNCPSVSGAGFTCDGLLGRLLDEVDNRAAEEDDDGDEDAK